MGESLCVDVLIGGVVVEFGDADGLADFEFGGIDGGVGLADDGPFFFGAVVLECEDGEGFAFLDGVCAGGFDGGSGVEIGRAHV